jgi:NAD(P)-dependent dehydrogenase (short-subunit alcohol dehydrogenase family)
MSLVSMFKSNGPSGFGANSTAEQVTAGLSLAGKNILITGCNSGLGKEALRVLSLRGARVFATARTREKAQAASVEVGAGKAVGLACELSDPASVRACIESVKRDGARLDAIICNAGIMGLPTRRQAFGVELQFFTNHIGHFILVTGLIDRLADAGRVVMLSSAAHNRAPKEGIQFDNLSGDREYSPWAAYGQSKLANLLFAKELARRLANTGKTANAVHPGVIATNLTHEMNPAITTIFRALSPLFLKTPEQGAATECFVATHPSLATVSGQYFADCNVAKPLPIAENADLAKRLWAKSEEIVAGLTDQTRATA